MDKFGKVLDVKYMRQSADSGYNPSMEAIEELGAWTIKTSTTVNSMELEYNQGDAFKEPTVKRRELFSLTILDTNNCISKHNTNKEL